MTAEGINLHLDHIADVTPELIMNLMMKNTIERGEDISRCAELYTVGIDGAGLATVADSFGAIEDRIEKERVISWDTLYSALDDNFSDERTRLIMQSAPKYCSGNSSADRWAKAAHRKLGQNRKGTGNAGKKTAHTRVVFLVENYRIRQKGRSNTERQKKR